MLTPAQAERIAMFCRGGLDDQAPSMDGPRIDGYRIVREIGSGGMGTVYEAMQDRPRRRVAIKVLRGGLASRLALQRFRQEAELLGRLRHPGVAQILESGTYRDGASERPFIVMEHVAGALPITIAADQARLSLRDRVELLAQVCDAVEHGHGAGIVHRDLKPANVLVAAAAESNAAVRGPTVATSDDRTGADRSSPSLAAKVIDFGVAKALTGDPDVTVMPTEHGQLLGTIHYMSPEQCAGDPSAVDARSDVYALGLILFELATGRRPHDRSAAWPGAAVDAMREHGIPAPSSINAACRGDLDAIVLCATAHDPARRYAGAGALAHDLRAHLAGERVTARLPGAGERGARWMRRHPAISTAACFVVGAAWLWLRFEAASAWSNRRPCSVEIDPEHHQWFEVRSPLGRTMRLDCGAPESVILAGLVDVPGEQGGGRRLLVATREQARWAHAGALCLFDAGDLARPDWTAHPLWRRTVTMSDLPPTARALGPNSAQDSFALDSAAVADFLPGHPGDEVLAIFQQLTGSLDAVRIYGLDGELLFDAWHDGHIGHHLWCADHGLLVLAGLDSSVRWVDLGVNDVHETYPTILMALRPAPHDRGWIAQGSSPSADPGEDPIAPAWYRYLWPPSACDLLSGRHELTLARTDDNREVIRFELSRDRSVGTRLGSITFGLDARGVVLRRAEHARYGLEEAVPHRDTFDFVDRATMTSRRRDAK